MRRRRIWEPLLLTVLAALLSLLLPPRGSSAGLPEGEFIYQGDFVVSRLALKDGRFKLRESSCTYQDQLTSEGAYYRRGDTVVLQPSGLGKSQVLKLLSDGFLQESDGYSIEYIQHGRADGSRVPSPRQASWLGSSDYSEPPPCAINRKSRAKPQGAITRGIENPLKRSVRR